MFIWMHICLFIKQILAFFVLHKTTFILYSCELENEKGEQKQIKKKNKKPKDFF